jgi:hypothetical protein
MSREEGDWFLNLETLRKELMNFKKDFSPKSMVKKCFLVLKTIHTVCYTTI